MKMAAPITNAMRLDFDDARFVLRGDPTLDSALNRGALSARERVK
jgi:hypothetical protein